MTQKMKRAVLQARAKKRSAPTRNAPTYSELGNGSEERRRFLLRLVQLLQKRLNFALAEDRNAVCF